MRYIVKPSTTEAAGWNIWETCNPVGHPTNYVVAFVINEEIARLITDLLNKNTAGCQS